MIGSKGRRKPYKDKIRNLLVNRTSPVLVSSEREGSGIDSRVCTILGHFRKPAFALLTRIPQATPTNLSTEAGNPSALVIMVRRGAPAASRSKVIRYLRKAGPEPHVQVSLHVARP